jgi:uncharacterized protein YbbC (DUF1343 family)
MTVITGLERFIHHSGLRSGVRRIGLACNHSAVDRHGQHAVTLLSQCDNLDVVRLFSPEHGLWGTAQDMEPVDDGCDACQVDDAIGFASERRWGRDSLSGIPLVSLYGHDEASLRPAVKLLADLDALVFDIQDIGSRYYTYAATMALCLEACADAGTRCIVLDRPNPITGSSVEGNRIRGELQSFVGTIPVPQRHGLTMGELALFYVDQKELSLDLRVISCLEWQRRYWFDETGLLWVFPSPNMPSCTTATVYPGMCLIEATNLSEGRGTTRPFELCGAPYVDGQRLASELQAMNLPGVVFRPHVFKPMFHKHAGEICGGVQLHIVDREAFYPLRTGLAVLWQACRLWPEQFRWRTEQYEFRGDVAAIDLLTGTPLVRQGLKAGVDFTKVYEAACRGGESFEQERELFLLYN